MFLCYKGSVSSFTCNAFLWRFFDIFTISTHTAYLTYKWLFYQNLRKRQAIKFVPCFRIFTLVYNVVSNALLYQVTIDFVSNFLRFTVVILIQWLLMQHFTILILFYCICQSVSYNREITAVINFFSFVQYDICMLDPILMQYWFYCHVMFKWDYVRHNFIDDNILLYFWSFISPWVSHSYQCHMG